MTKNILTNYLAALQLCTDDYALDLSCTDFPDLASFIAAIDAALTTPYDDEPIALLDSMIADFRALDYTIADDLDAKRIRAYYAANSILTYDSPDRLFASRPDLDAILARDDSYDLLD